ncbi:MAG: motility protein A, partial [Acidobacteriia bacterium]|nr:motility protein A [Terriglobia bacterium]
MKRIDLATLVGLLLAIGGILVGNYLEGGKVSSILQPTAALIVFGGTLGAVFVTYPMPILARGLKAAIQVIGNRSTDARGLLDEIVRYAQKARKEGIISLEGEAQKASDPFLKRAILMAVDGVDSKTMHETLELELQEMDEQGDLS